jgi:hypothetical protein
MKRIIVYRYYHKFESNRSILRFLKYLNPNIPIYGLFGGSEDKFMEASEYLKNELAHNYLIKEQDPEWKWKHGDITYQIWYNEFGHTLDFDVMHSVEWDLLYFDSLDNLFAHVPAYSAGLTGLIPLSKIEDEWYWVKKDPGRTQWILMMDYFKTTFNYNSKPWGMIGPGTTLPRLFLEKLKDINVPLYAHDELRIPMFAQVFGINMVDNGFFKKWFSFKEWRFFNSNAKDIEMAIIRKQLKKKKGRRVFHPYRLDITFETLVELYNLIPPKTKKWSILDIFR